MTRINWISAGAIFSALAVAMGAFGAHALRGQLDDYGESIYAKAVLYHMFHCLGIFVAALLMKMNSQIHADLAAWLFVAGIILFSGSLYMLAITDVRWLGMVTPFGGVSFITGWIVLALKAKAG